MSELDPIQKEIEQTVANNPVVVFAKGTAESPMCGFSKAVMDVFTKLGVPFKAVDVLSNPAMREGVKQFTQWPTLPQVFIKGEFIGGCDIVRDLYAKGELQPLLKKALDN